MKKEKLIYDQSPTKLKNGLPLWKWLEYENGKVTYDEFNNINEIRFCI